MPADPLTEAHALLTAWLDGDEGAVTTDMRGWRITEAGNFCRCGVLVRECADGWEWLWPDDDHQPDVREYSTPEAAMHAADVALHENETARRTQ